VFGRKFNVYEAAVVGEYGNPQEKSISEEPFAVSETFEAYMK